MQPLTVCMFSNLYPPVVSGSSTQTSALSRELSRRGHKVLVITAHIDPSTPEYEEIDGVSVYRLPALRLPKLEIALNFPWLNYTFTPANLRRVESILRQHKPDVIHLHNHMFDLGPTAVLMSKRTRIPLVITLHTVIRHSKWIYNSLLYPADRVLLRRLIVDRSDQLICPDLNVKSYAREAFGRHDAVIVPYGIDLPTLPENGQVKQIQATYGLNGKRIILSLGHVHDIRNRHDLIAAMPDVLRIFPNAVLFIVGAVSTSSPLQLARSLGVEHAVVFSGPLPHQVVPGLMAMADLEAHWLNQEEPERTSLGIASLEAMAAGKVVLAAANPNTYGIGILKSGENIIITERGKPDRLGRTIVDLLSDQDKCQVIGQRAQKTINDHFSWDKVCEQTLEVYRQVIQGSTR